MAAVWAMAVVATMWGDVAMAAAWTMWDRMGNVGRRGNVWWW
jgi:hypothetical protein